MIFILFKTISQLYWTYVHTFAVNVLIASVHYQTFINIIMTIVPPYTTKKLIQFKLREILQNSRLFYYKNTRDF